VKGEGGTPPLLWQPRVQVTLPGATGTAGCRGTTLPAGGLWIRGGVTGRQSQPSPPGHRRAAPGSLTAHFLLRSRSDTKDVIAGAGPGPARSPARLTPLLLKPEESWTHFMPFHFNALRVNLVPGFFNPAINTGEERGCNFA